MPGCCLMPNPVHPILVPATADGLARAIGETHRQCGLVNARQRWNGHLFQGRFSSVVLDEEHLMRAARTVAPNPCVRVWCSDRKMRRRFRAKNERKLWHQARKDAPAQDRDRIIVRPAN